MAAAHLRGPAVGYFPSALACCDGKIGFVTPTLARDVAKRHPYEERQVYRCRNCGKWHLARRNGETAAAGVTKRRDLIRKEERATP